MTPPPQLFVVGSGRSGTTIVLSAIAALDDVTAIPRLAGRVPALTAASSLALRAGIGPDTWLRPSSEATAIFAEAGLTQEFQCSLGGRSVGPEDAHRLRMARLARRLRSVACAAGVSTVVVKNTASCGRVPLLAHVFPHARFVHVLRPPLPVVASLLKTDFWQGMTLWWDGRTAQRYAQEEGLTEVQVAARHWARQVSNVTADLGSLPAERRAEIRYEDFTADPAGALQVLNRWGIATDPEVMRQRLEPLGIVPRADRASEYPDEFVSAVKGESAEVAQRAGFDS